MRHFLTMQPWSAMVATSIFLAPALLVGAIFGVQALGGALVYLGALFLIGEVSVKWTPWRKKFTLRPPGGGFQVIVTQED